MMIEEKIREALKNVIDPELGVSIVDLGLIYDVRYEAGEAEIEMTLTSPGCPLAGVIDKKVREVMKEVPEIKNVTIELVWDPPWSTGAMSEELRAELGID
ncbi:MAG: putative metal-sulfur cluster biosynthetic enzyme [Candidatus Collierbacteria bacterium GW2011_GWB1_45_35]|uniref:Putative metal-sulfur cluster biosynthetic enzyme n=2 Tax=Candidatus Collieribacteriota TaxID=1752725 RepID=A0A0G1KR58_9BACT|nr:MAG: putative metal-sulfur cluster biosynthetic enzyme [Microgenomates group bacterium GW2011_GWC1_44_23]KKT86058.1 MAG: putative metal-sulfur cluster biosynthetic enzyme [Candidatus Collierbacteria bacterium GW2011_GWA2_44_99]KKT95618.1 MAG: putative metal-sulfur cluster biosynthetic enzyme [Candidatus Collierbacteria bacterium GW2011_GWA1_45_15]KKU00482.1 MAG: putative metal-sulfur cluster biosynthetic enzyme [Candidatus Collierbacteria bacterium GW2011_GWB2_45_17]KKU05582.1 MAG: putative 